MTMRSDLIELLCKQWASPLDALFKVHCLSLSQRVGELRRQGFEIEDRWIGTTDSKRFKEYRIVGIPTLREVVHETQDVGGVVA